MQESVDYEIYHMSGLDKLKCIGIAFLLTLSAAWILYKSVFGMLLFPIVYRIYRSYYSKGCIEKRKRELLLQFKDAMQSLAVALLSGCSIENAWKEAEKEMVELYGDKAYMTCEIHQMNRAIRVNQPVEVLLYEFAKRSHCEDILGFAEVFKFARRNGGNLGKIVGNTVNRIAEKIEVEREIDTILSGKKMEQKIMNMIPIGLLAYLNITSEEFLAPLYGNVFGVCTMTAAFCAYLGAFMLAGRILKVKI